ncbi:zinc dependent phospholipase C family protein [Iodobacter fluviatilis]|uniref:Phospholipase C/D domain-containing protein n=1 Tax=Iodobacter fluviatilis TaxID=537 RepID=A0A7G3G7G0_9NEIS|nr:zinc dependent phospholipase C family protein [Iodobacter fluviatilis]QBC42775.1 hypothetical protein C1H71_03900 [Iodobacter fluviatilis]
MIRLDILLRFCRIFYISLFFSLGSGTAHAFKIDTHIWVGQQVINDLADDGKITINLRGKPIVLDVPADVKAAILANKTEYLLGNMGPDSAPDLMVGQTIVHPGVEGAWSTSDWLQFLLQSSKNNPAGKSYTYGYLGHAAADMFAHTYVNQYAGDVFNLADETLVEQRHIALEGFISKLTPPLLDHTGRPLGSVSALVKPTDAFGTFVRDTLVMNDTVQNQYNRSRYGRHLSAYYEYRRTIDAIAQDPFWQKLDVEVLKLFSSSAGLPLSTKNAQIIIEKTNQVISKLQRGEDNIQAQANEINAIVQRLDNNIFLEVKGLTQQLLSLEDEILRIHIQISNEESKIRRTSTCPGWWDPGGKYLCNKLNDEIDSLNQKLWSAVGSLQQGKNKKREELLQTVVALRDATKKTEQLMIIITNAHIDFGQRMGKSTSPIQSALIGWRNDIDIAMREYVKATSQSLLNTTEPSGSAFAPMRQWFGCYHLSIIGLAQELSGCEIRDGAMKAFWAVDRVLKLADDLSFAGALLNLPSPSDIRSWRDAQLQRAKERLLSEVAQRAEDLLPAEARDILQLFSQDMNDQALNSYFSKPENGISKGLLSIPDISARVRAEMKIKNNAFDPQKYAVVSNAITLAKLSLLDKEGLIRFAKIASAPLNINGKSVFFETDNILAGSLTSIDGNHQWMPTPPPRPNAMGVPYTASASYASPAGFVPWRKEVRESLFRSMFIGPLSPGIDAPNEIGFPSLLKADYPYRSCSSNPFPDDPLDNKCLIVGILPILIMLLD